MGSSDQMQAPSSTPATPKEKVPVSNAAGMGYLLLVSALWGTYTPALRYLFTQDQALSPQTLTAYRSVISAATLVLASTVNSMRKHASNTEDKVGTSATADEDNTNAALLHSVKTTAATTPSSSISSSTNSKQEMQDHSSGPHAPDQAQCTDSSAAACQQKLAQVTCATSRRNSTMHSTNDASMNVWYAGGLLLAGLELGVYNFLGTACQATGIEFITATKAAFLTQVTGVLTPCLAWLTGQRVLMVQWIACIAALTGSCLISLDGVEWQHTTATQYAQTAAATSGASSTSSTSSTMSSASISHAHHVQPATLAASPTTVSLSISNSSKQRQTTMQDGISVQSSMSRTLQDASQVVQSGACLLTAGTMESPTNMAFANTSIDSQCSTPQGDTVITDKKPACNDSAAGGFQPLLHAASMAAPAVTPGMHTSSDDASQWAADMDHSRINSSSTTSTTSSTRLSRQPVTATSSKPNDDSSMAGTYGLSETTDFGFKGEVYTLAACLFYALATVRLSVLAPRHVPVQLAAAKTSMLAAISVGWLFLCSQQLDSTGTPQFTWDLPEGIKSWQGISLLVYSAVGPGALAAVFQTKGQAIIPAAQAQVVLSLTPVWAAVVAGLGLSGEGMGPVAWLGAGLIVTAGLGLAYRDYITSRQQVDSN